MGDSLKKVKSGDDLVIPAQTFNTFVDSARDFLARQHREAQTATSMSGTSSGRTCGTRCRRGVSPVRFRPPSSRTRTPWRPSAPASLGPEIQREQFSDKPKHFRYANPPAFSPNRCASTRSYVRRL